MQLNFDSNGDTSKRRKSTRLKAALGFGGVAGIVGLGSTLAASINLNGGQSVEFGQGVAATTACDSDGFSVKPETAFDNEHSIFRVTSVNVSGLDLTPEGFGWESDTAITGGQAEAKLKHPGKYFNGTTWIPTCDNVVLDFRAYTDNPAYALYTDDAIDNSSNTAISSPIGWSQEFEDSSTVLDAAYNPGFAIIIDVDDDGMDFDSNYAVYANNPSNWHGNPYAMELEPLGGIGISASNFRFSSYSSSWDSRPNAASISRITVQSMKQFPSSYYAVDFGGPGNPISWLG